MFYKLCIYVREQTVSIKWEIVAAVRFPIPSTFVEQVGTDFVTYCRSRDDDIVLAFPS